MVSSSEPSQKLRILLMPFFVTSHIGPFTDLAAGLAVAGAGAVEPTVAVTPANVAVVRSALERHSPAASGLVKVVTYPFPHVDGLAPGVENLSAAGSDAWRIDAAAIDESLTRPAQEALIRERSPDAVISDIHFFWNTVVAAELGVPCATFVVTGPFTALTMGRLTDAVVTNGDGSEPESSQEVVIRGFPWPEIRIPVTEMPEFLRCGSGELNPCVEALRRCFGQVMNTFFELEQPFCEVLVREGHAKRAYFVAPLSPSPPPAGVSTAVEPCFSWLASKPSCSVLYICFGSFAAISADQLRELALGLEASGQPFLWVVRADGWAPPDGSEECVGAKGMLVRGWVPQTKILAHRAVGAFLSHCGSSSVLEAVTAGVPMLTWPLVFDQFVEERLVMDVLRIGEKVWNGPRSTRYEESEVVPAEAVARAVATFLEPGGAGEAARGRARDLAAKAHAAVAEGGSSYRDLRRLIDDLIEARAAAGGTISPSAVPAKMSGNNADGV